MRDWEEGCGLWLSFVRMKRTFFVWVGFIGSELSRGYNSVTFENVVKNYLRIREGKDVEGGMEEGEKKGMFAASNLFLKVVPLTVVFCSGAEIAFGG